MLSNYPQYGTYKNVYHCMSPHKHFDRSKGFEIKLTVNMKGHNTPVLSSNECVFSSIASVCFCDCQAMNFPNNGIVEALIYRKLDLDSIS